MFVDDGLYTLDFRLLPCHMPVVSLMLAEIIVETPSLSLLPCLHCCSNLSH